MYATEFLSLTFIFISNLISWAALGYSVRRPVRA